MGLWHRWCGNPIRNLAFRLFVYFYFFGTQEIWFKKSTMAHHLNPHLVPLSPGYVSSMYPMCYMDGLLSAQELFFYRIESSKKTVRMLRSPWLQVATTFILWDPIIQVMSITEEYADADEDGQLVLFEFIELIRQLRIWACRSLNGVSEGTILGSILVSLVYFFRFLGWFVGCWAGWWFGDLPTSPTDFSSSAVFSFGNLSLCFPSCSGFSAKFPGPKKLVLRKRATFIPSPFVSFTPLVAVFFWRQELASTRNLLRRCFSCWMPIMMGSWIVESFCGIFSQMSALAMMRNQLHWPCRLTKKVLLTNLLDCSPSQ